MSVKAQLAVWAMIGGAMAVPLLLMIMLGHSEPISRNSVFGCYTTANAPALLVRDDAIHIIEPLKRKFSYVAEASKTSYQLNVRPALALSLQENGRYAFVEQRGIGYFWPLLPEGAKNRNRVRHPEEYAGQFEVATTDGAIVYTRMSGYQACHDVR